MPSFFLVIAGVVALLVTVYVLMSVVNILEIELGGKTSPTEEEFVQTQGIDPLSQSDDTPPDSAYSETIPDYLKDIKVEEMHDYVGNLTDYESGMNEMGSGYIDRLGVGDNSADLEVDLTI